MGLKYDSLNEYSDYLVQVINSKTQEVIEGLLDNEDLSYLTGAQFGASSLGGVSDFLKGAAQAGAGRVGGELGKNAVANNFTTVLSTFKGYEGSSDTGFNISMHIFPGSSTYQSILTKIHKLTQPETENSQFLHSYLYGVDDASKLTESVDPFKGGLIHVSIGDWFLATGMFCTSSNISLSKYVDTTGKPIYMVWSAEFVPYKVLNATELASWVRK